MGALRVHKALAGQGERPAPLSHTLSEAFPATPADASAVGFALSCLPRTDAPILWVQDRLSRKEAGRPMLAGVPGQRPIIMVDLSRAADVLWAMEDGLRCRSLAAVIGEVWGDPPALDFTATKRLALRAEASEIPIWLIRTGEDGALSAARERWRVGSLPSDTHPLNAAAPGAPVWEADLFRARGRAPGIWAARYDTGAVQGAAGRPTAGLRLLSRLVDGSLAQDHSPAAQPAGG